MKRTRLTKITSVGKVMAILTMVFLGTTVFSHELLAQTVIVAERGGFVSRVDLATGTRTVIANVPAADGIVMENLTTALVSQFGAGSSNSLIRLDITTGSQSVVAGGFQRSQGVLLDGLGNVLICEQLANQIQSINLSTGAVSPFITGLSGPIDAIYEDPNTLLISNAGTASLLREDLTTGTRTTLTTGVNGPIDLIFDGAGNVIVAEFGGNRVTRVSLSTGAKTVLANVSGAHSVLLDPSGDLFILSYNLGTISRLTPGGTLTTIASGMVFPTFFLFEPDPTATIPTLTQWGLIVLGLSLLCMGAIFLTRIKYGTELV